MRDANSTEFKKTSHPVVDLLPEQKEIKDRGATMRLGAHDVIIKKGSLAHKMYNKTKISERHRHRYEINPDYIKRIEKAGMIFSGKSPDEKRMEIAEIENHPFFAASQFHPEFKSRLGKPAPLFLWLVKSAKKK